MGVKHMDTPRVLKTFLSEGLPWPCRAQSRPCGQPHILPMGCHCVGSIPREDSPLAKYPTVGILLVRPPKIPLVCHSRIKIVIPLSQAEYAVHTFSTHFGHSGFALCHSHTQNVAILCVYVCITQIVHQGFPSQTPTYAHFIVKFKSEKGSWCTHSSNFIHCCIFAQSRLV